MRKIFIYVLLIALTTFQFLSCAKMDDNYSDYLDINKVYSPKVTNLTKIPGLKQVRLKWDNPTGDIAKKIFIDYMDSTVTIDSMITSYHLTGLEIKGYDISVYTMDAFDNLSVPETVSVFPNGELN
ncbi:MAG: DUF4998 domain-containing protein [Bacteroidales bacterium]|nr:DUF4998 domain-containing protein [Bacteroidales bacterium]MCF8454364.1 DUF4998 domain-containing protein [Bacteroidales bacterium]